MLLKLNEEVERCHFSCKLVTKNEIKPNGHNYNAIVSQKLLVFYYPPVGLTNHNFCVAQTYT